MTRQNAKPHMIGSKGSSLASTPATELLSAGTDTRRRIAQTLRRDRVSPDVIYAFEKTGNLVNEGDRDLWTGKTLREWDRALRQYRRQVEADSRTINLCFTLHHENGRSETTKKKRFAASEFAIAALCAHDQGVSSFTVESLFREAWLDYLLRLRRTPGTEPDPTDHDRFDNIDAGAVSRLLDASCEDLPHKKWSANLEKRIARIQLVRNQPDTWLGRLPDSGGEEEPEEILTIDDLQNALAHCEYEGVAPDLIESMLLRSWVRMWTINTRRKEQFFQVLDKNWDQVHARVQVFMAQHSGLRLQ
ncbi:MAG TPA: hypothetical protein VMA34_03485 [Terracidiphilus sp.]|nr:hypothetical protein [Terracidiphilus sp.]